MNLGTSTSARIDNQEDHQEIVHEENNLVEDL